MNSDQPDQDQDNVFQSACKLIQEFQFQMNAKKKEFEKDLQLAYEEREQMRKEKEQWEAEKARIREIAEHNN